MLSKKKKIIILCGMLVLLVVTGVLNIVLNQSSIATGSGDAMQSASFFQTYRSDRVATREQTILYLDAIIANSASDADAVKKAQDDKLELTKNMELELVLEGLIKALGYDDAVVTDSTENVNVIIKAASITAEQAAQILEVIVTETDKKANNVRIIPVE